MVNANAITSVSNFVMKQVSTLEERLACLLKEDGGRNLMSKDVKIFYIHNYHGQSGYNYWVDDKLVGQLYIGTLLSGTYVIYKKTFIENTISEEYDYYGANGEYWYSSTSLDGQFLQYISISYDPTCPFINHIYNVLHSEYESTTFNFGNTQRIQLLETIIRKFYKSTDYKLSANDYLKDQALIDIKNEIIQIEKNSVLNWSERQAIFKQLKEKRARILSTKRRVHKRQYMLYDFVVMITDLKLKAITFSQRPISNFTGSLYKYTLGNFFWFCSTVKNNLGYSVALAIYGPFTFYFITQPMNPHAMWAVGKVRTAYLNFTSAMDSADEEIELVASTKSDTVNTTQAAPEKLTDLKNKVTSWDQRMGDFKAMQIAYEADMVEAERMGRFEQLETIYNFPLTAEAAWMEMELYYNDLDGKLKYLKLAPKMVGFLEREKKRTLELQFYIWQKMGQYFIDHPYIVVDQDNEQPMRNYYSGRQFIFFEKMTEKIKEIGMAKSAITHKNIEMLADKFSDLKKEGHTVLGTLRKNSRIFQQDDLLNSKEHRSYMKRQWEVVFIQQSKKEVSSTFALQTYTWSIRNAMWLLQTIYSAKRSEIGSLVANYQIDTNFKKNEPSEVMNEYLGNMFNNMVEEFVSIRKEMLNNLHGDAEAKLRERVINNVKNYLEDRDKMYQSSIYAKR